MVPVQFLNFVVGFHSDLMFCKEFSVIPLGEIYTIVPYTHYLYRLFDIVLNENNLKIDEKNNEK